MRTGTGTDYSLLIISINQQKSIDFRIMYVKIFNEDLIKNNQFYIYRHYFSIIWTCYN